MCIHTQYHRRRQQQCHCIQSLLHLSNSSANKITTMKTKTKTKKKTKKNKKKTTTKKKCTTKTASEWRFRTKIQTFSMHFKRNTNIKEGKKKK